MIYKEEVKDLFSVSNDYHLCQCISADFGMGAGIAVLFNRHFDMKNKMKALHKEEGLPKWNTLKTGYVIPEGRVINLITKKNYWHKPTYYDLIQALEELKAYCLENNITKLAMPLIACGIDRLEWVKVSEIVKSIFDNTEIEILVCKWK